MDTPAYYVVINKRYYTVKDFNGSLLELKEFANFWSVEVLEDLPK
jgi:hypothetical protein